MKIIGKWQAFWTTRPESDFSKKYISEYTSSGEYIQEYPPLKEGGEILRPVTKCQYDEGKVTHFMKGGNAVEFTYKIDESDILTITNPRGDVWKLKRVS